MTWCDPSLVDVKEPDWAKAWSPMVIFRNEVAVEEISKKIFVSDPSRGIVFCYIKYTATFYEILERARARHPNRRTRAAPVCRRPSRCALPPLRPSNFYS